MTVPEYGGGFDDQGAKKTAQEADRNGATTRTGSYAQCVLDDMRAQSEGKRNGFCTFRKSANVGPGSGCELRYVQRHFVNVSALERVTLRIARCDFCK